MTAALEAALDAWRALRKEDRWLLIRKLEPEDESVLSPGYKRNVAAALALLRAAGAPDSRPNPNEPKISNLLAAEPSCDHAWMCYGCGCKMPDASEPCSCYTACIKCKKRVPLDEKWWAKYEEKR